MRDSWGRKTYPSKTTTGSSWVWSCLGLHSGRGYWRSHWSRSSGLAVAKFGLVRIGKWVNTSLSNISTWSIVTNQNMSPTIRTLSSSTTNMSCIFSDHLCVMANNSIFPGWSNSILPIPKLIAPTSNTFLPSLFITLNKF